MPNVRQCVSYARVYVCVLCKTMCLCVPNVRQCCVCLMFSKALWHRYRNRIVTHSRQFVLCMMKTAVSLDLCTSSSLVQCQLGDNLMPGAGHKYDVMLKPGDLEDEKVVMILQTWLLRLGYQPYTTLHNACVVCPGWLRCRLVRLGHT